MRGIAATLGLILAVNISNCKSHFASKMQKSGLFAYKTHKKTAFSQGNSYLFSIFTAISRAIFIILVKLVWRSSAESSVPLTRLSEMEQMARARLPV